MSQQYSNEIIGVVMTACMLQLSTVLPGCFQKSDHTIVSEVWSHTRVFLSIMVKSYTTDGRTHQFFVGLDLWQSLDIPRKFSRASLSNLSPGRLTHNL